MGQRGRFRLGSKVLLHTILVAGYLAKALVCGSFCCPRGYVAKHAKLDTKSDLGKLESDHHQLRGVRNFKTDLYPFCFSSPTNICSSSVVYISILSGQDFQFQSLCAHISLQFVTVRIA